MAETLKVVMMTRYTIDPIPVEYNACILHVLEAYQELREKVDSSEVVLEGVKEDYRRDVDEFGGMSLRWETKVCAVLLPFQSFVSSLVGSC